MDIKASKIIIFLLILSGFFVNAQKIKVKDDKILIDKNEVGTIIDAEENGDFDFYILDNQQKRILEIDVNKYVVGPEGKQTVYQWMRLKQPNEEKINTIDYADVAFSFNLKKLVIAFLTKKYNFFTKEKIVTPSIEEFFKQNTTSEEAISYEEYLKKNESSEELVSEIKPFVKNDLTTVVKGGSTGTVVIGRIVSPDKYHDTRNTPIQLFDLDDILIASATTDIMSPVEVSLIDNSNFSYKSKNQLNGGLSNARFLTELVEQVVGKGFELENHYTFLKESQYQELVDQRGESFENAKANSTNIYDQPGFAVNDKGERFEGTISINFEEIKDPNDPISRGIVNLDDGGIGSVVTVRYTNENGKKKVKGIAAKKNAMFCIKDKDDKEICYQSLKVEGGPIVNDSDGAMALMSSKGKFLKEVYNQDPLIIYQYEPTQKYYLKIDSEEKAFDFDISGFMSKEKKAVKLKEYLGGCDYTKGNYDKESFQNLDYIKELINFYNTSCK